ncbi:MAG: hypothetical protein M1834_006397 [Cirrosporium novae-zelandiae]|nr:MAG: hypothetical protein M1834_006397 [Cirrosporium novae-zelandiae]
MPIKIPKALARRKASGHGALEEVENPPASSFRVLDRPQSGLAVRPGRSTSKSFDGGSFLKRSSQVRPLSSPEDIYGENAFEDLPAVPNPNNNRASGGTTHTVSTGGLYDSSSSSARYSSTSTLPSSMDEKNNGDLHHLNHRTTEDYPIPPVPHPEPAFSFRAAGRTFSFGMKGPKHSHTSPSIPTIDTMPKEAVPEPPQLRERALTTSSYASTATPPKLLDSDFNIDTSDLDGFGNMFEGFGKRKSRALTEEAQATKQSTGPLSPTSQKDLDNILPTRQASSNYSQPTPTDVTSPTNSVHRSLKFDNRPAAAPSPLTLDYKPNLDNHWIASPRSWASHDSHDGLMSSVSPALPADPSDDRPPAPPRHSQLSSFSLSRNLPPSQTSTSPVEDKPFRSSVNSSIRRSGHVRKDSMPLEDKDANIVNNSIARRNNQAKMMNPDSPKNGQSYNNGIVSRTVGMFENDDEVSSVTTSWKNTSNQTTPRPKTVERVHEETEDTPLIDQALLEHANLATTFEDFHDHVQELEPPKNTKIMTPAQFERYRREQEMHGSPSQASKSESDSGSEEDYDDEDETERNREAVKQRRKQEAHLAIYRQQMMKVTGESSIDDRSTINRATMSTPNLMAGRMSSLSLDQRGMNSAKTSEEDEDEDVPLGILAAHGFPGKNRPPTRLSGAPPMRLSTQAYPPPPGSVAGGETLGGGGNLPVFARHLPQDPYYGAGLVNPSNRESLAFGREGTPPSIQGPSGVPPGGLVGVIASEERAKAMRRGSPNPQAGFGGGGQGPFPLPLMDMNAGRSMTMGNMVNPMSMGMPAPQISPKDQSQIEMNQQITQMMQMQMQWMQTMMQFQGMPVAGGPQTLSGQPPNFLGAMPMSRPLSMASNLAPPTPPVQQRSMSMMNVQPPWNMQANQSHTSLAPGGLMPGGYTPSIAPSERSNVGMPPRYRPVSIAPADERPSNRASTFTAASFSNWKQHETEKIKATATATIRPVGAQDNTRGIRASVRGNGGSDDEDDDKGWEEMKKKREKKKNAWKLRKGKGDNIGNEVGGLEDLYSSPLTAAQ